MKDYLDPLKCEYCAKHSDEFVPPEIPEDPKLIVLGEAPGKVERREKRPFVGDSGQLLRPLLPASAILINAANVYSEAKPTSDIITIERNAHLLPLLKDYPGLPVVSLGAFAAQALMGGKRSDTSMAGEVLWLHDRHVWFTYHPAYYFHSGEDPRVVEFIKSYLHAAVAPPLQIEAYLNELPMERLQGPFVLDIEATSADLPFYGSKVVLLGIMTQDNIAFQYTADWLADQSNISALQRWIDKGVVVGGHGIMYDILMAESVGLSFEKIEWYDTMLAEKDKGHDLLWGFGLKPLAHTLYNAPGWEAKFHSYMKAKTPVQDIPLDDLAPYNAGDLFYTKKLAETRYDKPYNFLQLDNDYLRLAKRMVVNGLYIDRHALAVILCETYHKLKEARARGRKEAGLGPDFNFNSPKQLLPLLQRLVGQSIPNTREQTLMTVYDSHPFIATLLEVRGYEKTVEMLREIKHRIVKSTGLLHSHVTVHGAESGRMSSKGPNIQNWAEKIRKILVSRYGRAVLDL